MQERAFVILNLYFYSRLQTVFCRLNLPSDMNCSRQERRGRIQLLGRARAWPDDGTPTPLCTERKEVISPTKEEEGKLCGFTFSKNDRNDTELPCRKESASLGRQVVKKGFVKCFP